MMETMRCERCQSEEVTVRILDVRVSMDGRTVAVSELCKNCARTAGVAIPHAQNWSSMLTMLAKTILPAEGGGAEVKAETAPEGLTCPACGWTLRDLRQTSRFGCPRDYEVFGPHALELLDRLQGFTKHCNLSEESEVDRLATELTEAVAQEDYEAAARIRDQIRNLEASLEREDALD